MKRRKKKIRWYHQPSPTTIVEFFFHKSHKRKPLYLIMANDYASTREKKGMHDGRQGELFFSTRDYFFILFDVTCEKSGLLAKHAQNNSHLVLSSVIIIIIDFFLKRT